MERASMLLERCASRRSRRDALHKEKWALQLELDRFLRVDQIEERERTSGADTIEYERAILDAAAEQSIEEKPETRGGAVEGPHEGSCRFRLEPADGG